MTQYIDKSALVAEIERFKENANKRGAIGKVSTIVLCNELLSFLDTLEVKEVGISIPNIDDNLKEEGLDPESKEAKIFKESYYTALEKLKAQKGE